MIEVLRYVAEYRAREGMSPSQREIAKGLNISQSATRSRLKGLTRRGLIRSTPRRLRSLMITTDGMSLAYNEVKESA